MGPLTILILLGMASWLATLILVEGELFAGLRLWVDRQYGKSVWKLFGVKNVTDAKKLSEVLIDRMMAGGNPPKLSAWRRLHAGIWHKLKYLVSCHLCAGMWVSLAIAAFLPPLVSPWVVGWVLNGLIIKAIGHLVLVAHKLGERWTRPGTSEISGLLSALQAKQAMSNGRSSGSKLAPFDPLAYNNPREGWHAGP